MSLTPRLEAVKNAVPDCACVLDAGTDHAYVPIALVKEGRCSRAIASDINKGPLARAKNHIEKEGLPEKIETRLGSGLSVVKPGEVQAAVLAGMGGVLIAQLLEENPAVVQSVSHFVLQPMNAQDYLRHYLHKNRFCIEDEYFAAEDKKIYVILKVSHGTETYDKECYYHIGKRLFEKYRGQPILAAYLDRRIAEYRKMVDGLRKAERRDEERIGYLEQLIKQIERMG